MLTIRLYGDPILRRKAAPIGAVTDELRSLADGMIDAMQVEDGVGLSAPQVGVLGRLVVATPDPEELDAEPVALVNPVVERAHGEWTEEEGCLSLPDVYAEVTRPEAVDVRALDMNGRDTSFTANGWFARVILHEICSGPLELGTGVSNTRECCRPIERGYDDGETTIVQPAVQDRVGAGSVARSEDAGPDLSGT